MAELSAALVKELREKTGAGMLDCKKALVETNGNIEEAVDYLRKKGLASAAKKSGRVAAEGLVSICTQGAKGTVLEVNSETDFVARNEQFQAFVKETAEIALKNNVNDIAALENETMSNGKTVKDSITNLIATIGENMTLRRVQTITIGQGVVSGYIHSAVASGLGKIGVLVAIETAAPADKVDELGKQIAMHIAAARPDALTVDEVDQEKANRERNIILEQTANTGKPADIIAKMVEGRMRKYYEDVVLLEQLYMIDGESRVKQVIEKASKDFGAAVAIKSFTRYALGEGIDKPQTDFAAEVAAQAGVA